MIAENVNMNTRDITLLKEKQISIDEFERQLENYEKGFPNVLLIRPATIEDGIHQLSPSEISHYINVFETKKEEYHTSKFIPASGAATRMFKALFNFSKGELEYKDEVLDIIRSIEKFSFSQKVIAFCKTNETNSNF